MGITFYIHYRIVHCFLQLAVLVFFVYKVCSYVIIFYREMVQE